MLRIADRDVNVIKRSVNLNNLKKNFKVGSQVNFEVRGGKTVSGDIIKMNPKKARVQVGTSTYAVPYQQLILN